MSLKKSIILNIIAFITLLNLCLLTGHFTVCKSVNEYEFSSCLFDLPLKFTSFGITFLLACLLPLEFYIVNVNPKFRPEINIQNKLIKKLYSVLFFTGFYLFILRLIIFFLFPGIGIEFMWDL